VTLRWSETAVDHLQHIYDFIAGVGPEDGQRSEFAANVVESIIRMAERLLDFSQLGHAGRVEGTREVILTPLSLCTGFTSPM
jgi:plasmid stabilization system protein ParE